MLTNHRQLACAEVELLCRLVDRKRRRLSVTIKLLHRLRICEHVDARCTCEVGAELPTRVVVSHEVVLEAVVDRIFTLLLADDMRLVVQFLVSILEVFDRAFLRLAVIQRTAVNFDLSVVQLVVRAVLFLPNRLRLVDVGDVEATVFVVHARHLLDRIVAFDVRLLIISVFLECKFFVLLDLLILRSKLSRCLFQVA